MTATLFIDSAYDSCSVGLWTGATDTMLSDYREMRYGQAEIIMPMVRQVLSDGNVAAAGLSEIVVNIGPGRFTGIRLAIAAAKALALPFDTPLSGITGMRCYAHRYFCQNPQAKACVVALASGRGNFFVQYLAAGLKKDSEIKDISPDEIRSFCSEYGNAVPVITDDIKGLGLGNAVLITMLKPEDMVLLWLWHKKNGVDFAAVNPLYVRPPDVSLPLSVSPVP